MISERCESAIPESDKAFLATIAPDVSVEWELVAEEQNSLAYGTHDEVVRVRKKLGDGALAYEATIATAIPRDTGYPGVTSSGNEEGRAWMRMPRAPGTSVATDWSEMSVTAQEAVLESCASKLGVLHRHAPVLTASVVWSKRPPYPPMPYETDAFGDLSPTRFNGLLDNLVRHEWIDLELSTALAERHQELCRTTGVLDTGKPFPVSDFLDAIPVHGDAHLGNFLHRDNEVTALLDFEQAQHAPADNDLFRLIHCAGAMASGKDAGDTRAMLSSFLTRYDRRSLERMCLYYIVCWTEMTNGWLQEQLHNGSTYRPQLISEEVVAMLKKEIHGEGLFVRAVGRAAIA